MTSVTLEHLTKAFTPAHADEKKVTAVRDLNMKITSGDVLAILGPSGCGKSTLLKMIAGTMPPDSGRVLYDDQNLTDIPLRERGIGMVFQEGALIPHWEAETNIGFFFSLRKREAEVPQRLKQISKITGIGLDELLNRRPRQLSGGERQRVGIARALSRDLNVLLLDEPFASLDAKYRAEARVELKRLLNAFPVTSVYVTHDQVEAIALAHRIAVMRDGRMEQIGTYTNLYNQPQNLFVATFIGTPMINLFKGRVENGRWQGENFGGLPVRRDLAEHTPLIAGIRAEHIQVLDGEEGVEAVVDTVVPYLSERHQLVTLTRGREQWTLIVPLNEPIHAGSALHCGFKPDEVLFFDPKTGVRVG